LARVQKRVALFPQKVLKNLSKTPSTLRFYRKRLHQRRLSGVTCALRLRGQARKSRRRSRRRVARYRGWLRRLKRLTAQKRLKNRRLLIFAARRLVHLTPPDNALESFKTKYKTIVNKFVAFYDAQYVKTLRDSRLNRRDRRVRKRGLRLQRATNLHKLGAFYHARSQIRKNSVVYRWVRARARCSRARGLSWIHAVSRKIHSTSAFAPARNTRAVLTPRTTRLLQNRARRPRQSLLLLARAAIRARAHAYRQGRRRARFTQLRLGLSSFNWRGHH